ncbi:tetratricopeptide repeat protein [Reticulibacter mediterranei]|uniref:Tetratricopeptide repeat protein n=1 Tax=Reticulibacter mediterranei TaxID=2778369 RepID=A0A8J3IP42_9CHLR|nr:tetratricopeptide repeat protein [Reticulibacter mediterranei]GHO95915.1 tetratricopeptide repeat protein [Reticulibacter mediterranei]
MPPSTSSDTTLMGEQQVSHWQVPFERNPYFTGRETLLLHVHDLLNAQKPTTAHRPVVLSGLGGIGKTQLALEYAYRYREEYSSVFWLQADTHELLVTNLVTLAQFLDLPTKDDVDQTMTLAAVKRWMQTHTHWFCILDNVQDLEKTRLLLPSGIQGHVLFTARSMMSNNLLLKVEPGTLEPEEAVQLLLRRGGQLAEGVALDVLDERTRQLATRIANELLGKLPLALDQAGAYIERTQCGLEGYIERYQQRRTRLLQERGSVSPEHPDSVAATWSLSFIEVEQTNAAAADLLRLCAFLHPDAILEKLITEGVEELTPALQPLAENLFARDEAMEVLFTYSLLYRNAVEKTLSIHRLVQVVLKESLEESVQREWAERTVCLVNRVFPESSSQTWQRCQQLLAHAQVCAESIEYYRMVTPEALRLLDVTGHYLHDRGHYHDAEVMLQQLLAIQEQLGEKDQLAVAHTLNTLGELARLQGKYQEAQSLYERALILREKMLGSHHPDVATSLNHLARSYHHFARYAQAETLYQHALTIRGQVLGVAHPDVAHSLNDLAELYREQGKYQEARPLYERALMIREQVLGPEHPDTATSLGNLAGLCREQGRYEEALPLCERAQAIYEQVLGAEHPDTAMGLNNLAELYAEQGKHEEALPLFQRSLTICEEALGPEHPSTAMSLNNLAGLYEAQGKRDQAIRLYKRSLAIGEKVLGAKHPDIVFSLNNLALAYSNQSNFKYAEPLFQRALRIIIEALGPEHPTTVKILLNYALMLRKAKRNRKADEMEARAKAIQDLQEDQRHLREGEETA